MGMKELEVGVESSVINMVVSGGASGLTTLFNEAV
jgi:hypothetical protein